MPSGLKDATIHANSIADLQETNARARRETLPIGSDVTLDGLRAWMLVERFLALNPERTVAYACAKLGLDRTIYEVAKKRIVGGDMSFSECDRIRSGDRIVRKNRTAKGNYGKGD
jgi:hypothetical protein